MKITAEFNSTEELLSFISTFGTKAAVQLEGAKVGTKKEDKKADKVTPDKEDTKIENTKEEVPTVEAEKVGQDTTPTEIKDAEGVKEPKVTKEQVRAVFAKLIQSGKQKEAKELTTKYGANKLPDVKEEDYAAILKEAEELL